MKFTVAVLATLAVTLSAAPVMASVADSTGPNSGYEAHRHHHHHHHRRHHGMAVGHAGDDVVSEVAAAIA
jgi:Spy/CpxP family protein refolding chaperone